LIVGKRLRRKKKNPPRKRKKERNRREENVLSLSIKVSSPRRKRHDLDQNGGGVLAMFFLKEKSPSHYRGKESPADGGSKRTGTADHVLLESPKKKEKSSLSCLCGKEATAGLTKVEGRGPCWSKKSRLS